MKVIGEKNLLFRPNIKKIAQKVKFFNFLLEQFGTLELCEY